MRAIIVSTIIIIGMLIAWYLGYLTGQQEAQFLHCPDGGVIHGTQKP